MLDPTNRLKKQNERLLKENEELKKKNKELVELNRYFNERVNRMDEKEKRYNDMIADLEKMKLEYEMTLAQVVNLPWQLKHDLE